MPHQISTPSHAALTCLVALLAAAVPLSSHAGDSNDPDCTNPRS